MSIDTMEMTLNALGSYNESEKLSTFPMVDNFSLTFYDGSEFHTPFGVQTHAFIDLVTHRSNTEITTVPH